jgi:hypothetical protein
MVSQKHYNSVTRVEELDEMVGALKQMRTTQVRAVLSVTRVLQEYDKGIQVSKSQRTAERSKQQAAETHTLL